MIRLLCYLFFALALAAFAYDVWRGPFTNDQPLEFTSTAEHWTEIHRASLIGLNSSVEKNISPDFWDTFLLPALTWPAFVLMGALGFVFYLLGGIGRKKKVDNLRFPRR